MAASHPLQSGIGAPPPIEGRLQLNTLPPGECLSDLADLQSWIEDGNVSAIIRNTGVMFGSAGEISNSTTADRNYPRITFDSEGRYLGILLYVPEIQNWSIAGVPGELKTIFRTEDTVEEDMEAKFLSGWFVADGENATIDLTPQEVTVEDAGNPVGTFTPDNNGFFSGEEEAWDVYTVQKKA